MSERGSENSGAAYRRHRPLKLPLMPVPSAFPPWPSPA